MKRFTIQSYPVAEPSGTTPTAHHRGASGVAQLLAKHAQRLWRALQAHTLFFRP